MDRLWSPWRYSYVSRANQSDACIFCDKVAEGRDEENLVVWRAKRNFILLNLFPYCNGHILIAPYEHVANLEDTPRETLVEMIQLAQTATRHLRTVYRPSGLNLGMNLGECAGAGVAGHIHMHVVPRWPGDVSFMTAIGETRVMPEDLHVTWEKLHRAFHGESA